MRRVLDDSNLSIVAEAVYEIIRDIQPSDITVNYADVGDVIDLWSVSRFIRAEINRRFGYSVITFGASKRRFGAYGCRETTELVFHDTHEQQICGYLSVDDDRQYTVRCWLEDINHCPLIDYPSVTWSKPTPGATN